MYLIIENLNMKIEMLINNIQVVCYNSQVHYLTQKLITGRQIVVIYEQVTESVKKGDVTQ